MASLGSGSPKGKGWLSSMWSGSSYSKIHKYAVKFGRKMRRRSQSLILRTPSAGPSETYQAIQRELQDLDGKADLISNFTQNGFSKNGPYVDPSELNRLLTLSNDDLIKQKFDANGKLSTTGKPLTGEQRAELRSVKSALGEFKSRGLDHEEFAALSDQQVAAMAASASKEAMRPNRWLQGAALGIGAFAIDQVVFNGAGLNKIGEIFGFQAPAEKFSNLVNGGLKSAFGVASIGLDAGLRGMEKLGIDPGYGKVIAAVGGGWLLTSLFGKMGENMGGGAGKFLGMSLAVATVVGTLKSSGIDVNYKDNFIFGNPSGPGGGYAELVDTYAGTPSWKP